MTTDPITGDTTAAATAARWQQIEIAFQGPDTSRPYLDVDGWVEFTHSSGEQLRRPMFFDGGTTWRVRFASTQADGNWAAMRRRTSRHTAGPPPASQPPKPGQPHPALTRGFPRAAGSHRTFCYADGSPLFLVIDTAWALPWRATLDDVAVYAADRQAKGFNAVLMMSVQPDMNTRGPEGRNIDEGLRGRLP